jgi:hypothetical protein
MWNQLTGDTPESALSKLSSGKGLTVPSVGIICEKIDLLMIRHQEFAPAAFMDGQSGIIYRRKLADWYSRLHDLKKSLNKKSRVVYLADAVNDILTKNYKDEIGRLATSIQVEKRLVREKHSLTDDQRKHYDEVTYKIKELQKRLEEVPVCNNDIITMFLHRNMAGMTDDEKQSLGNLNREIMGRLADRSRLVTELKDKSIADNIREGNKTKIGNIDGLLPVLQKKKDAVLEKYYSLTPELIADFLRKYSGTFWDRINVKKNVSEVSIQMAAAKKAKPSNGDDVKKKKVRRKKSAVTLKERAEKLCLYPYKIVFEEVPEDLESDIDNDLAVIDRLKQWSSSNYVPDFSAEYQNGYLSFWRQLKTTHKKENIAPTVIARGEIAPPPTPNAPVTRPAEVPVSDDSYEVAKLKFNKGVLLDPDEQMLIIEHGHCPSCGCDNGFYNNPVTKYDDGSIKYPANLNCKGCGTRFYFLPGERKIKDSITPSEDRKLLA